jgi:hypothetical protein
MPSVRFSFEFVAVLCVAAERIFSPGHSSVADEPMMGFRGSWIVKMLDVGDHGNDQMTGRAAD